VLLVPKGKDIYWLTKWLTEQAAESALSKVGAVLIGGMLGPILAGFVASLQSSSHMRRLRRSCGEANILEGSVNGLPVIGVTSGFNV
jgi:hypothetical protein